MSTRSVETLETVMCNPMSIYLISINNLFYNYILLGFISLIINCRCICFCKNLIIMLQDCKNDNSRNLVILKLIDNVTIKL